MALSITVNGEQRELASPLTLQAYLESLDLAAPDGGVAVIRNGEVVRRTEWPEVTLQPDDELEIVRATAGG